MSDLSASYAMNIAENPFGDGDGYGRLGGVIQSASQTPGTPAAASTAPRPGMQTHHHFAGIVIIGVVLLYLSHHLGFRGTVAV
jgi:hypothetical protein